VRQPRRERAGFETRTVGAAIQRDVHAAPSKIIHARLRERGRFVVRIVQDLNLQTVAPPIERGSRVNQSFDDIQFVVDGQLDRDARHVGQCGRRDRLGASAPVQPGGQQDVESINGERGCG